MWNESPENFQPNDAGGVVFKISSANLDAPLVVDGLNKVTISFDDAKFSTSKAASGMTTVNKMRTKVGKAEIEVMDSSTSMDTLSTLADLEEAISFTFTDPVTPNLNSSCAYCFLEKHADIARNEETNMSTWTLVCPVLKTKTGGFTIVVES